MEYSKKKDTGITIIALVVTIIVLLILAGIGIAMLTGENSIIKKAIQAKEASNEAEAIERVQLEVLGSLNNDGNIDKEILKKNLSNNLGVQGYEIQEQDDGSLDFPVGDYNIHVDPIGNVKGLKIGEILPSQSASDLKIGQYINYTPDSETIYESLEEHNGADLQTIDRETLSWRILSVDGDSVKIISNPSSQEVAYAGVKGYNNAVKDLNDMCETLYSHGDTKARSVNLDDFTTNKAKVIRSSSGGSSGQGGSAETNFEQTTSFFKTSSNYNICPEIYELEYRRSFRTK